MDDVPPPLMFSDALEGRDHPSEPHLNPRSCVTCRKRKVRCDKHEPCGNCTKAHIDCIFPAPGRAPRKPRKPPDAELLKRLKRLEGVVQSLGAHVDENGEPDKTGHADARSTTGTPTSHRGLSVSEDPSHEGPEIPLGKLVISEGRSRYVNNVFWNSVGNEISDIRDILGQSESEEEDPLSPDSMHDIDSHRGFVFGFSSLAVDMKKFYPSPSQIFIIWEIFKENIDPILKVLHCPSVKNLILKAAVNTDNLSKPAEALFFSICFGSIVSMTDAQCVSLMGETKVSYWKRYRFATEQALARADFLNSSSLVVLQAFVFYLICLRYYDDSKSVWSLGGLAIHQAYTLGLHRDGTHFGLDPFETEMRRRLWWHIAALDVRAAEDHGSELRASSTNYDTKFPSNVNDEDIWPGMTETPASHTGPTEMTFCLIRFELSAMTRRLGLFGSGATDLDNEAIQIREKMIDECHRQVEERYIRDCNMNVPIYWVAATVSRLILAKMWLKLHHPRLSGEGLYKHPDVRDRVFNTSVEVIEFGHLLESNANTAKWGWLFRSHMQWHAVAYVLSELAVRPPGVEVDRAWRAVDSVYEETSHARKQRGMLWKPIRHLMTKARQHQARGSVSSTGSGSVPPADQGWLAGDNGLTTNNLMTDSADQLDVTNLGLDFNDTGFFTGMPSTTTALNNSNPSPNNAMITPPETHTGSTPDFLSWDGWSPGVGQFTVGAPPTQSFGFDYPKVQEWF